MRFIHVSKKSGIVILETSKPPTTEQIQNLVGRPGEIAQIETLYRRFTHTSLIILQEQSGELKSLPIVARIQQGENIFGDFLVLRNVPHTDGFRLEGLTHSQILIVNDELHLCSHPNPESNSNIRVS
jgi:hypothetical protein